MVVYGAFLNATIDDDYGNSLTGIKPEFFPPKAGVWEGEECPKCPVKPDPQFTWNKTYNAATYTGDNPISIEFPFVGTAIYVYLTIANDCGPDITTLTEVNFTVDDGLPELFRHEPNMSTKAFEYQFLAFNKTGLEHRSHKVTAKMDGPNYHTFLNFDYAEYTYDDTLVRATSNNAPSSGPTTTKTKARTTAATATTPTTPSSTSASDALITTNDGTKSAVGHVVGGVFGGLFILSGFIFALIVIRRKVRKGGNGRKPSGSGSPEIVQFTGHLDSNHPIVLQQQRQQHQIHRPHSPPAPFYLNDDSNQHQNARVPHTHHSSPSTSSLGGGTVQTSLTGPTQTTSSGSSGRPVYTYGHHRVRLPSRKHVAWAEPVREVQLDENGWPIPAPLTLPRVNLTNYSLSPTVSNQTAIFPITNRTSTAAVGTLTPSSDSVSQLLHLPSRDLDSRVQALQQAIHQVILDIQAESEALSRSGVSEEQIDRSLEVMWENLRVMAEQMAVIQVGGGAAPAPAAGGVERLMRPSAAGIEELPGYESPTARKFDDE